MKNTAGGMLAAMVFAWTAAVMAAPETPKIPKRRWLDDGRGFQEALELQKATGADIMVYFFRYDKSDEKGLCRWFETKGLQNGDVEKFLDDYIKVKVQLPLKPKERDLFDRFKFNKCPAVYIVKPEGFPQKCSVFDWPNDGPQLKKASELIEIFKARSSAPAAEKPDEAGPAQ